MDQPLVVYSKTAANRIRTYARTRDAPWNWGSDNTLPQVALLLEYIDYS